MNTLSLYVYLIDVFASLKPTFYVFAFMSIIGAFFFGVVSDTAPSSEKEYLIKYAKRFIFAIPILLVLAALVPNRDTMYLMAASEVGEEVIMNPEVAETMGKVKTILDQELDRIIGED